MRPVAIGLTVVTALLGGVDALLVTDGSPCDVQCGNTLDSTSPADIVCQESQYGTTSAGITFESCTRCQLTSNYTANNQSDLQWMIYNARYAVAYCLFDFLDNKDAVDNPCITTRACGPLKDAIEYGNMSKSVGALDFCSQWDLTQADKCGHCLQVGDNMHYLNNFVAMMNATCIQRPAPGNTISVQGDPFSIIPMNITTPGPKSIYNPITGFPVGGKVGIAAGCIVFILSLLGCCIVWNGKRRRRRFLRELEEKHLQQGWPHPKTRYGGPDMLETPASQKPLRGWDDAPTSAATDASADRSFQRYFSPYSSQYTSPVSAVEGPAMQNWPALSPQKLTQIQQQELEYMQAQDELMRQQQQEQIGHHQPPAFTQWPTSTQEKLLAMAHERQQASLADGHIGVAIGGDEASLRSKPSNPDLEPDPSHLASNNPYGVLRETFDTTSPAKGKNREESEAYEMHEVPISGGGNDLGHHMPAPPQAPVLHHPGYGRHPSLRRTGTGSSSRTGQWGLTEEDAIRGHAV